MIFVILGIGGFIAMSIIGVFFFFWLIGQLANHIAKHELEDKGANDKNAE